MAREMLKRLNKGRGKYIKRWEARRKSSDVENDTGRRQRNLE